MTQYIKILLIKLGLMKAPTNGTQLIAKTLNGFVDIVEKLHEGAKLTAQEMEGNSALITSLTEQNMELQKTNTRAYNVRQNLLALMGE